MTVSDPTRVRWPKRCACGAQYSRAEWTKLALVGRLTAADNDRLEIRNCVCGSSIAVEIADLDEDER
jgi:hypothetical protein